MLKIGGEKIKYVSKYSHLSHIINNNFDDRVDNSDRRCKMIGQINNLVCFFLSRWIQKLGINCFNLFAAACMVVSYGH